MSFTEDLTVFFDTEDFADSATYTTSDYPHPSNQTQTISGIFSDEYVDSENVIASDPNFLCAASSVADNPSDDSLTHDSIIYIVREFALDGAGLIVLILEEQ